MNIIDVTIHIPRDLDPVHQESLENEVRLLEGVKAARFNYSMKHWLSVVYDPESITSWKILNQVRLWDKDAIFFSEKNGSQLTFFASKTDRTSISS